MTNKDKITYRILLNKANKLYNTLRPKEYHKNWTEIPEIRFQLDEFLDKEYLDKDKIIDGWMTLRAKQIIREYDLEDFDRVLGIRK